MTIQSLLRSKLRLAMIPLVLLFSFPGHAEERFTMLSFGMNFGSKGVGHAELGLMSRYMNHDDVFDDSRSIQFARYAVQPAGSQWSFDVLGTRIAGSQQYRLHVDEKESDDNTGKGIAKTVLIGGLVVGGLYLLATEAFDDNGDDLIRNANEDAQ